MTTIRNDDPRDLLPVSLDLEDAQAIAQNISENLQHDEDVDKKFWQAILERLKIAIEDSAL